MKTSLQPSSVLVLAIVGLTGCSSPGTRNSDLLEVWPDVVRAIFRTEIKTPYLIVLRPDEGRTAGSDFPVLIVPAGPSGFDRFTPLAFLPDDDSPPVVPAPDPPAPDGPGDGNGEDEDNPEEGDDEPEAGDDDDTAPADDWPPVDEFEWPPPVPIWPPPLIGPPTEDDIDEMLDDALRKAFEDAESPPEDDEGVDEGDEDGEEHPLEDRFWTPVIPPNLPSWWDPFEVPDVSPPPDDGPDFDFRLPRWKDLEPGMLPPPGWPGGVPWLPDDGFRLPERWRPSSGGYRLRDWRIYIVPLSGNG